MSPRLRQPDQPQPDPYRDPLPPAIHVQVQHRGVVTLGVEAHAAIMPSGPDKAEAPATGVSGG